MIIKERQFSLWGLSFFPQIIKVPQKWQKWQKFYSWLIEQHFRAFVIGLDCSWLWTSSYQLQPNPLTRSSELCSLIQESGNSVLSHLMEVIYRIRLWLCYTLFSLRSLNRKFLQFPRNLNNKTLPFPVFLGNRISTKNKIDANDR